MKHKTLLMLMIVCFMGLLSSAEQNGKKCIKKPPCTMTQEAPAKPVSPKAKKLSELALPPLHLLRFDS